MNPVSHRYLGFRESLVAMTVYVMLVGGQPTSGGEQVEYGPSERPVPGPDLDAEVEVLIEQLGHHEFGMRELASRRLTRIGQDAILALQQGTGHRDREVRLRCQRILARVRIERRRRQLAGFLLHQDYAFQEQLPGWSHYESLVGDTPHSRKLFGEMLEAEWDFLRKLDAEASTASEALSIRCSQVQTARSSYRQRASVPTIASLLLMAGTAEVEVTDEVSRQLYFLCIQVPAFRDALNIGKSGSGNPLRKLTGHWIRRGEGKSTVNYYVHLALRYNLDEGVELATRLLESKIHPTQVRQNAVLVLAKLGQKKHRDVLTHLLNDRTECIRRTDAKSKKAIVTQIRDVALAAIIHLSGKHPKDFGYQFARTTQYSVYIPHTLGFTSEATRNRARELWESQMSQAR